MATHYMGHRITVFTKITIVYFGNLNEKRVYFTDKIQKF